MVKSFASAALILAFFLTLVSARTTDDSSCGLNYTARYGTSGTRSLSIANGGAGQSGLIEAWALKFIDDSVANGTEPFYVDWYLGDTTQSLAFLQAGDVDIAVTYNEMAEEQAMSTEYATRREYAFQDHFYLVGPTSDPANLTDSPDLYDSLNRIVTQGNADTPPSDRPATRFLSRYDKSATNIKESLLFTTIGQVPWALTYSNWYHQYPRFPLQALKAASVLNEYTLTDRGTWLSSPSQVTDALNIYKRGDEDDPQQLLLNPAHCLQGANAPQQDLASSFMDWVISDNGGQEVVATFMKNGEALYTPAPTNGERLMLVANICN
ncbi:hypothetical protein F5887DRAFT_560706 [Amanita rubescens]|nr:hypothetical protein F5887DRAFT_560706 [Amanita rubescens]